MQMSKSPIISGYGKKTLGFPNQGERYGAKYENGVAYLLSYTVSVEKMWTQNTCIIHDV